MSCWVVPAIAAEMWGVSVQSVLDGIGEGRVGFKQEDGFLFVDVAPDSASFNSRQSPPIEHPATYTIVTRQELEALAENLPDADVFAADQAAPEAPVQSIHEVRRRVSIQRRGPGKHIVEFAA